MTKDDEIGISRYFWLKLPRAERERVAHCRAEGYMAYRLKTPNPYKAGTAECIAFLLGVDDEHQDNT